MKKFLPFLVVGGVLLLDQTLKIWIKLNFPFGEVTQLAGWFKLYFIENEGMAFGMKLGGADGKLILTLLRIGMAGGIIYYLVKLFHKKSSAGLIISVSLILAGALGNLIDSVFYGVLFSESSSQQIATWLPVNGGYESLLHGHVVDMLFFPIFEGYMPNWIPLYGGDYVVFFQPIFNVADASISCGVLLIVLFQKQFFNIHHQEDASGNPSLSESDNTGIIADENSHLQ